MAKTYTLTEVAESLDVDPKSLRRWIEIEKWDLGAQTTVYDKRIKFLTEDQVAHLAKAHERLWPPKPRSAAQAEAQATGIVGAVNLLRDRVDTLREDHVGITMFNHTIKHLEDQIEELERKYTATLKQLTDALLAIQELQDQGSRRPARKAASDDQGETTELEPGLVGAAAFADLHRVNPGTAKSAWQSGRVPTVKGSWRLPGVRGPVQYAFDAQGRARFYELYKDHDGFTPCPECPHH